jgi:hypothetical protein
MIVTVPDRLHDVWKQLEKNVHVNCPPRLKELKESIWQEISVDLSQQLCRVVQIVF